MFFNESKFIVIFAECSAFFLGVQSLLISTPDLRESIHEKAKCDLGAAGK
jgi:hypothetical protein